MRNILILFCLFIGSPTFASGNAESFIKACVASYNKSDSKSWYACWDQEVVGKLWERQAKKNGMTVEQMLKMGFDSQRRESGEVTLGKSIESCKDKMVAMHHYYYEAQSVKQGKLGLRFDIVTKKNGPKIGSYNYTLCSQNPQCVEKMFCR